MVVGNTVVPSVIVMEFVGSPTVIVGRDTDADALAVVLSSCLLARSTCPAAKAESTLDFDVTCLYAESIS